MTKLKLSEYDLPVLFVFDDLLILHAPGRHIGIIHRTVQPLRGNLSNQRTRGI